MEPTYADKNIKSVLLLVHIADITEMSKNSGNISYENVASDIQNYLGIFN